MGYIMRVINKAHQVSSTNPMRVKLKAVTFCLNEKPIDSLLWCNKVPKGKRNKPAKINGVQHSEISESMEHVYYQGVR